MEEYILNPLTNRRIKRGGLTHKRILHMMNNPTNLSPTRNDNDSSSNNTELTEIMKCIHTIKNKISDVDKAYNNKRKIIEDEFNNKISTLLLEKEKEVNQLILEVSSLENLFKITRIKLLRNSSFDNAKQYLNRIEPKIQIPNKIISQTSYIYFIREKDSIVTKIGITHASRGVTHRLKELQTGNSRELILYDKILMFDAIHFERAMHIFFKDKNIRGEWFNVDNEDIRKVLELTKHGNIDNDLLTLS
jgi:hypothetical protein